MNSCDSEKHPIQRTSGPRCLPNPTICRGQIVMKPDIVRCRVHWPTYCIHVHRADRHYFFCNHPDRLKLAARGVNAIDRHAA